MLNLVYNQFKKTFKISKIFLYNNFCNIIKLITLGLGLFCVYIFYLLYNSPYSKDTNWVVVQLNTLGTPIKCFSVRDRKLYQTPTGITWQGELEENIFISLPYRAARVPSQRWEYAYSTVGISSNTCFTLETSTVDIFPYIFPNIKPQNNKLEALGETLELIY